jgi:hypothetical protein
MSLLRTQRSSSLANSIWWVVADADTTRHLSLLRLPKLALLKE